MTVLRMATPKFSNVPQSFHSELKKRISDYFEDVGASTTGNYNLFIKAVSLMVAFTFVYIHLVFLHTHRHICDPGMRASGWHRCCYRF